MRRRRIFFGGHETAEVRSVRRTGGWRGLREGTGRMGCLLDDLRAFGIFNTDQWTTVAQDEEE